MPPYRRWHWRASGLASKDRPLMSTTYRRYEFLLPLRHHDEQPVPGELIADIILELEAQFGAVSSETQVIHGRGKHEAQSYRDELVRVFVDVPDVPENRHFFQEFKERLKSRFRQ